MNRTTFLIDGFNVYHSLVDVQKDTKGRETKWLNLHSLCSSFLPIAGKIATEHATLKQIYFFSAPPTHRSKNRLQRYNTYLKCLKLTGLKVELGRFKNKHYFCNNCRSKVPALEEKETDVAIASRLFEICQTDETFSTPVIIEQKHMRVNLL